MIRLVTVKTLRNYDKDKNGLELMGKFGKYYKYGLVTEEYPTKTIYGIGNKPLDWKAGDKMEIDLEEKGEYLNFKLPKKEDVAVSKVEELEKRVKKLEETLTSGLATLKADICLELTNKVQTKADYDKYNEPHPLIASVDDIPDLPF